MIKFALLLKTYSIDLPYVKRLLASYTAHNIDNVPLYLVVPKIEIPIFSCLTDKNINILPEESVTTELVDDNSVLGISPGYINQQIIKLAFWETGISENYFCIDADAYFIRDFYKSDFMFDENTPFTTLVEDNDLQTDPIYYVEHWKRRTKFIDAIKADIGFTDERSLTCHGNVTLSSKVLRSIKEKHMAPRKLNYCDLMKIAPMEFSWYNFWLQKDKTIPIEIREPLVKSFHNRYQHIEYRKRGVTVDDLARAYLGVVVNSNFSRDYGLISYDTTCPYGFLGLSMSRTANRLKRLAKRIQKTST